MEEATTLQARQSKYPQLALLCGLKVLQAKSGLRYPLRRPRTTHPTSQMDMASLLHSQTLLDRYQMPFASCEDCSQGTVEALNLQLGAPMLLTRCSTFILCSASHRAPPALLVESVAYHCRALARTREPRFSTNTFCQPPAQGQTRAMPASSCAFESSQGLRPAGT